MQSTQSGCATQKPKNRGKHTIAAERADQFEDLEVRGDGNCWCSCCHVVINVTEKSTASKHIATQGHKKRKLEATKVNIKPGVSAAMEGRYTPSTTPVKAKRDAVDASPAKPDGGVQVNLNKMRTSLHTKDNITLTRPRIRAMG